MRAGPSIAGMSDPRAVQGEHGWSPAIGKDKDADAPGQSSGDTDDLVSHIISGLHLRSHGKTESFSVQGCLRVTFTIHV